MFLFEASSSPNVGSESTDRYFVYRYRYLLLVNVTRY
jgi:hypothetical protein